MSEDLRQKLLAAKKDVEDKSGYKFKIDAIALADLISEFVSLKVEEKIKSATPVQAQPSAPVFGTAGERVAKDSLYGD